MPSGYRVPVIDCSFIPVADHFEVSETDFQYDAELSTNSVKQQSLRHQQSIPKHHYDDISVRIVIEKAFNFSIQFGFYYTLRYNEKILHVYLENMI